MIAILVVYLVPPDGEGILNLHLSAIDRFSLYTDYRIFAAVNRLEPKFLGRLQAAPNLQVCALPPSDLRGKREHAFYLDRLAQIALSEGAEHICTLDVDAFPIADGWLNRLKDLLSDDRSVVSVFRRENGDQILPHPSCTFFHRRLLEEHPFSFGPDGPPWPQQSRDTGYELGLLIQKASLSWHRLERTNAVDPHPVIGGIYGDLIFHLGAFSRHPLFRADILRCTRLRMHLKLCERLGVSPDRVVGRALDWVFGLVRSRTRARNDRISRSLTQKLSADPDALLDYLRSGQIGTLSTLPNDCAIPS